MYRLGVAGYFLSPPGMNTFFTAVNRTMGVLFLWVCTLLLLRTLAADERLKTALELLQQSETRFRAMADTGAGAPLDLASGQPARSLQ